MSRRNLPGPTEGSWSASPTNSTEAWRGTAWSRWWHSTMSSIEVSSTTTVSASSGRSASRSHRPSPGLNSSRRCSVWASGPTASPRLGRSPGGGRQCHPLAEGLEDRYHGAQYGCLAGPRPACQVEDLLRHGLVDHLPLFPGQFHSHPAAGPRRTLWMPASWPSLLRRSVRLCAFCGMLTPRISTS